MNLGPNVGANPSVFPVDGSGDGPIFPALFPNISEPLYA
jgi:hypothetical protein